MVIDKSIGSRNNILKGRAKNSSKTLPSPLASLLSRGAKYLSSPDSFLILFAFCIIITGLNK